MAAVSAAVRGPGRKPAAFARRVPMPMSSPAWRGREAHCRKYSPTVGKHASPASPVMGAR